MENFIIVGSGWKPVNPFISLNITKRRDKTLKPTDVIWKNSVPLMKYSCKNSETNSDQASGSNYQFIGKPGTKVNDTDD